MVDVRYGMRTLLAILSLIAISGRIAVGQTSDWRVDAAVMALPEAWDYNEARESLMGAGIGIDRHVWGPLAARGEGVVLRVAQNGDDGWLRGVTLGMRARWSRARSSPFLDVAVGPSTATVAIPIRGTTFNYLAVVGAGIEFPLRGIQMAVSARWLHISNNGREGRHRNPDIQTLGAVVGVGWKNVF
jgi:hypothetical protein